MAVLQKAGNIHPILSKLQTAALRFPQSQQKEIHTKHHHAFLIDLDCCYLWKNGTSSTPFTPFFS